MAKRKQKGKPNYIKAALALYEIGWIPFPLLPKSNILAVDWDEWQACPWRITNSFKKSAA